MKTQDRTRGVAPLSSSFVPPPRPQSTKRATDDLVLKPGPAGQIGFAYTGPYSESYQTALASIPAVGVKRFFVDPETRQMELRVEIAREASYSAHQAFRTLARSFAGLGVVASLY